MRDIRRVPDKHLKTIEEITARMDSIRRQIEEITYRPTRSHHISAFERKHEKIKKLNARLDELHTRRALLIRDARKNANPTKEIAE